MSDQQATDSLDRERFEVEKGHKEEELALRRLEVESQIEREKRAQWRKNIPVVAGIAVAAIGLLGTAIGTWLEGQASLVLEREKAEAELLLKMIDTGDTETSMKNLAFLVDANLISDPSGRIAAAAADPDRTPVLNTDAPQAAGTPCDTVLVINPAIYQLELTGDQIVLAKAIIVSGETTNAEFTMVQLRDGALWDSVGVDSAWILLTVHAPPGSRGRFALSLPSTTSAGLVGACSFTVPTTGTKQLTISVRAPLMP